MNRIDLQNVYLDWLNNFSSVSGFAEHYGLYDSEAEILIFLAKQCYENPHPEE
jgi:hypothetical protein